MIFHERIDILAGSLYLKKYHILAYLSLRLKNQEGIMRPGVHDNLRAYGGS